MNLKDLEKLGEAFSYFREDEFNEDEHCDNNCDDRICDCCGNYVDCGNSQSDCSGIKEAREEHNKKVIPKFQIENIYGFDMAIDCKYHIIGITDHYPIHIDFLNERFKTKYSEIKKDSFILIDEATVLGKVYEIPGKEHYFLKRLIDCSLELTDNAKVYFALYRPLIIQDKTYTILISPRYDEEKEEE